MPERYKVKWREAGILNKKTLKKYQCLNFSSLKELWTTLVVPWMMILIYTYTHQMVKVLHSRSPNTYIPHTYLQPLMRFETNKWMDLLPVVVCEGDALAGNLEMNNCSSWGWLRFKGYLDCFGNSLRACQGFCVYCVYEDNVASWNDRN